MQRILWVMIVFSTMTVQSMNVLERGGESIRLFNQQKTIFPWTMRWENIFNLTHILNGSFNVKTTADAAIIFNSLVSFLASKKEELAQDATINDMGIQKNMDTFVQALIAQFFKFSVQQTPTNYNEIIQSIRFLEDTNWLAPDRAEKFITFFKNKNKMQQVQYYSFANVPELIENIKHALNIELFLNEISDYFFIYSALFKGVRLSSPSMEGLDLNLPFDYAVATNIQQKAEIATHLVNFYKVHLMPKNTQQLYHVVARFLEECKRDQKLQQCVKFMKIKANILNLYKEATSEQISLASLLSYDFAVFPIIVIYPSSTKEAAEYVVNVLCRLFANVEGANITPRYNQKVTSLIYYAQGDGDYKQEYATYFMSPNRILYNVDQFNREVGTNLRQEGMALNVTCASMN